MGWGGVEGGEWREGRKEYNSALGRKVPMKEPLQTDRSRGSILNAF